MGIIWGLFVASLFGGSVACGVTLILDEYDRYSSVDGFFSGFYGVAGWLVYRRWRDYFGGSKDDNC